jgi:hypothetical protein
MNSIRRSCLRWVQNLPCEKDQALSSSPANHEASADLFTLRSCLLEPCGAYGGRYIYPAWCDADLEHGSGRLEVVSLDLVQWNSEARQRIHDACRVIFTDSDPQVEISGCSYLTVCCKRVGTYQLILNIPF